jgi:acyl carrier protein
MNYEKKISEFIAQHLLEGSSSLTPETPLFTSGLLDSFHLVGLLLFLEETFQVKIKPNEIVPELINTPSAIAKLIGNKVSA